MSELTPQHVLADFLGSGDFPVEIAGPEAAARLIIERLIDVAEGRRCICDHADRQGGRQPRVHARCVGRLSAPPVRTAPRAPCSHPLHQTSAHTGRANDLLRYCA